MRTLPLQEAEKQKERELAAKEEERLRAEQAALAEAFQARGRRFQRLLMTIFGILVQAGDCLLIVARSYRDIVPAFDPAAGERWQLRQQSRVRAIVRAPFAHTIPDIHPAHLRSASAQAENGGGGGGGKGKGKGKQSAADQVAEAWTRAREEAEAEKRQRRAQKAGFAQQVRRGALVMPAGYRFACVTELARQEAPAAKRHRCAQNVGFALPTIDG